MYNSVSTNHLQTTQTFSIKGIKALTIQKYKSLVKELVMADDVLKLSPAKEPLQTVYENLVVRSVQITDAVLKLSPAKEPSQTMYENLVVRSVQITGSDWAGTDQLKQQGNCPPSSGAPSAVQASSRLDGDHHQQRPGARKPQWTTSLFLSANFPPSPSQPGSP